MGKVTAAIELPYAVDDVFRVATRVEDMPRWLPEVVAAELLDPALVAGARIRLRLGPGTGNAEITGTIAELRPPTLLEITGSGGPLSVKVRDHLEPQGPSPPASRSSSTCARRHSWGSSRRRRSGGSRQSCRRPSRVSGRCWRPIRPGSRRR